MFNDKIVTDEYILKMKSSETTAVEVVKLNLKERIAKALKEAWSDGVGLAAIQIGVPLRYGYIKFRDKDQKEHEIELINPTIVKISEAVTITEGCLSIPDKMFKTRRYKKIMYRNNGRLYEAVGPTAVYIQHEIDHFDGVLCSERAIKDKIGRNDMCYCRSGKKYKKCCIDK